LSHRAKTHLQTHLHHHQGVMSKTKKRLRFQLRQSYCKMQYGRRKFMHLYTHIITCKDGTCKKTYPSTILAVVPQATLGMLVICKYVTASHILPKHTYHILFRI